jgi:phosphoglycerol transferase MdoB-like AlkP superfamily enzyme
LTTRVFNHLINPDEVVRTADYGMIFWYVVHTSIQLLFVMKCRSLFFKSKENNQEPKPLRYGIGTAMLSGILFVPLMIVMARGGLQPIPINTDAAYFSKNYSVNDLSVNASYFFAKSWMLFNRSNTGTTFNHIDNEKAKGFLYDFYTYPTKHDRYVFSVEKPNFVFILLESWTANAISVLSGKKGATPHFDALAKEGLLFTRIYATGGTSEIGNTSIFSGYPALPEVSISMQPEKHRKLPSINQDLKKWGYSSNYLFSGDLTYGNIGGYFVDHGFDKVEDENDFPDGLQRGKLNYYDEDLYRLLLKKINQTKQPFLYTAFTGSTHSPYDYPKGRTSAWKGTEADFMSSLYYADDCLRNFIQKCRKQLWYKNTVFVLVADHGHASTSLQNPNLGGYFHIPLLLFGAPLKKEFRGKKIATLGSQADITRTLLYQLKGDYKRYVWAKDLLNPKVPEFALHTINRGFGWITPRGNFSYHMDTKSYLDNTFSTKDLPGERKRCEAYMSLLLNAYEKL